MEPTGVDIGGSPSARVYEDTVDFDATSLYPSIILAFLIDAMAQYGRIVIINQVGEMVDAAEFVEALMSGDDVEVGRLWFGMPGLAELARIVTGSNDNGSSEEAKEDAA